MPIASLTKLFVASARCVDGRTKTDYFDKKLKGFMIEVRQNGSKTFYARFKTSHGTKRQQRIGPYPALSVDQARSKAQEIIGRVFLGEEVVNEHKVKRSIPLFGEFVTSRYMPYVKTYKRSWGTDDSLLRNHILPLWKDLHMDQITKDHVLALHNGVVQKGCKPSTANRPLILARYIFNLALEWGIPGLDKNPTRGVPLFEENNKRERYLSADEAHELHQALAQSQNRMLKYIVPMLILTGARKSEVVKAEWSDLDLVRRVWRIPETKSGRARHVPMSDASIKLLETVPRIRGCTYVFPNPKTLKPFESFFYAWDTARKSAGMPELRIHDLRHSFASFLVNNGRSLYEVQQILGHSNAKTTQRYAHLSMQSLIDAANSAAVAIPQSPAAVAHIKP